MEFLGIGPLELVFVLIIALIVLGPNDMVKAGRTLGRFLRKIVMSPEWRTVQQTSRELRYLPNKLIREAGLEDIKESLPEAQQIRREMGLDNLSQDMKKWQNDLSDWTTPPPETIESPPPPSSEPSNDLSDWTTPPSETVEPPPPAPSVEQASNHPSNENPEQN